MTPIILVLVARLLLGLYLDPHPIRRGEIGEGEAYEG
jgi:hypothetical protein